MTHDELLARLSGPLPITMTLVGQNKVTDALRAVVELHNGKGINNRCVSCAAGSKCETIQVIERELG